MPRRRLASHGQEERLDGSHADRPRPGLRRIRRARQLQYYADVTPIFREWVARAADGAHPVLHYFDNLPTAGVATRAARLRDWLAKRIARGERSEERRVGKEC